MTEEQCNKAVILDKERQHLATILPNIEKSAYKLCFIEVSKDSMTWQEHVSIRDMKILYDILDIHHVQIIKEIKQRILDIGKEIELL